MEHVSLARFWSDGRWIACAGAQTCSSNDTTNCCNVQTSSAMHDCASGTRRQHRKLCVSHLALVVCQVGFYHQHADMKRLLPVITDPSPSAMQDIDAPDNSQAGVTQPAVHVPRPTAKEAWVSQHQPGKAADQREGVMQGTGAPVTVLVSQRWLWDRCAMCKHHVCLWFETCCWIKAVICTSHGTSVHSASWWCTI